MLKENDATSRAGARGDFEIDGWLVQPQLNRMTAGGLCVQVQPKIMDVLVFMAEEAGSVVTKERLLQTVWAGTHVSGHVLSRSISQLRKIFNDHPQRPRVIETIPKVGYRLIAPVTREMPGRADERGGESAADADVSSHPSRTGWQSTRLRVGLGAISAAAVLLTLIIYLLLIFTRSSGHHHLHLHH